MKPLKTTIAAFIISIILISCGDANKKKTIEETVPEAVTVTREEKAVVKADTSKQMNILDEQAKMLGKVFGNANTEEGRAFSKVNNYLDLVEQANFPTDVKKNILDQYKLYELSLDPKKKDSLKIIFNQKFNEALAKSGSSEQ